jgi:hypothetical protein
MKFRVLLVALSVLSAASVVAVSSASATIVATPSNAEFFGVISISNPNGSFTTGDFSDGRDLDLSNDGSSGSTRIDQKFPSVSATATTVSGSEVISETDLTYTAVIEGPTGTVSVNVQAKGGVSGDIGTTDGSADLVIAGSGLNVEEAAVFGGSTSFSLNSDYVFETNSVYEVEMEAGMNPAISGSGNAFVDPMFTLPPGYTLALSPGIGNSLPPIPESSTWAMMLVGFAGLGFIGYRRAKARGLIRRIPSRFMSCRRRQTIDMRPLRNFYWLQPPPASDLAAFSWRRWPARVLGEPVLGLVGPKPAV